MLRPPLLPGMASLFLLILGQSHAEPTLQDLNKKPITTAPGEVGQLLRGWWRAGTAAGNVGDWYDNRDRDHSALNLTLFPQLRKVAYSDDDRKAKRDWALQPRVLPFVVFGNSSTSAPPRLGGSNVRTYYSAPLGLKVLEQHYLKNNLYIYPEHRDHDPGHNGLADGFGDLFPTNTPYLLTSQGSSGSDQPFLEAVAFTLAAFQPEVKKKLIDSGLLMPTLQMILRWTNSNLQRRADYYTGKAHPSAFDGSYVDPVRMVRLAQEMRADRIPPLVKLQVLEEDKPIVGRDYFDLLDRSEIHADTVSVLARIWRGHAYTRKLVVSAEKSLDLNKNPLTFRWVVLRGDDQRIQIKLRNKSGSVAEITVPYHPRRPIEQASTLHSNRVDIGVFAHNGYYPSAPAFLTFFSLDSEARDYDEKGRIREIGYGMGFTELKFPDQARLLAELAKNPTLRQILQLSEKSAADLTSVKQALTKAVRTPNLWLRHAESFHKGFTNADKPRQQRLIQAKRKLLRLGILKDQPDLAFTHPVLSSFSKAMLEEFNAQVLAELFLPDLLTSSFHLNYVDPRLAAPKAWRDVYLYEGDSMLGWRRYHLDPYQPVADFTPEGWLVVEKDDQGRPLKARTVRYGQRQPKPGVSDPPLLEYLLADEMILFSYPQGKRTIRSRVTLRDI